MTPAARIQTSIELLEAIATARAAFDTTRAAFFRARRYIGAHDRRASTERAFNLLRRVARLDWWIIRGNLVPSARTRVIADLAIVDGQGIRQIQSLFSGGGQAPARLSDEEDTFIRGLAGRTLEHPDMPGDVRLEYPAWLEPAFRALWGDGMAREVAALNKPAPLDLRVNLLKGNRDMAAARLAPAGIIGKATRYSPVGLRIAEHLPLADTEVFQEGLIEVQDEGSQIAALLVDARPGHTIVDYCAGGGGKTLALAAQMNNKGRIIACDIRERRLEKAVMRLRRAGAHNVQSRVITETGDKWLKRAGQTFDRVLVDAPCTGTGTWRRNPEAKWRLVPKDVEELVERQRAILASAARLVKPGGRLVYVTCSLLAAENEEQIQTFVAAHPEFSIVPVPTLWAQAVGGTCPTTEPFLRLTPATHETDGFFIATLTRGRATPAKPDAA